MLSTKKSIITNAYFKSLSAMSRSISTKMLPASLMALTMVSTSSYALTLDEKRARYESAISAIEGNNLAEFTRLKNSISDYPLYPYLDYRSFSRSLNSASMNDVQQFEKTYADLPFTRSIRARYLSTLAAKGQWKTLLTYQKTLPRGESYQCQYYFAHSQVGDKALALSGAKSLYLSGSSVDNACDPLFSFLEDNGKLNNDLILERMLLVFDKRNVALMRYLNKQLTGSAKARGEQIQDLYDKPQGVSDFSKKNKVTPFNQRLTRLAFERLARIDSKEAVAQFTRTVEGQHYTRHVRQEMADFVASRLMNTDDETLATWRDSKLKTTQNPSLLDRRIRVSLLSADWKDVNLWLGKLSAEEAKNLKWQYWKARVALELGNKAAAEKGFAAMLGERNFYSVAAASHLNAAITIPQQHTPLDSAKIVPFQSTLDRVDELLALDKLTAARREWRHLLNGATQEQKAMLAAYASQNKWYHLSVQATIAGKLWGHLEYRFPLAHRWWFEFFSKERQVPLTTLLALSRQESAFYTNAVSPVGARGLMQLMPATARETSKKLGFNYRGTKSLSDPGVNIRLGSGFLSMMLDRFDENRILAFAAYNAGPHRVTRWLERSDGNLDAISFIEAIPFRETRGYVQNVLMYDIYYSKLLGQPMQFLTTGEQGYQY
ncbi:murein transglycosylase [Enterovibrio norvegicus]|uniref:murein transglycosylase n=1 Tax=Enterovibrio norvegicus TaxID=188144 RepID=UPI00355348AF